MPVDAATTNDYVVPETAYCRRFASASTDNISFLPDLDRMLTLENANGYIFQASPKAYETAKAVVEFAHAALGTRFIRPEFMPDGESGIDIEWEHGPRNLTVSCRGRDRQTDFLYWEENGEYEGQDASLSLFLDRLNWLTNA